MRILSDELIKCRRGSVVLRRDISACAFFFCLFGGNCFLRLCCVFFEREVFEAQRDASNFEGAFLAGARSSSSSSSLCFFFARKQKGGNLSKTPRVLLFGDTPPSVKGVYCFLEKKSLVLLNVPRAHLKRAFTNETALIRRRNQTRTRRSSRARRVRGRRLESLSPV